jgi:glutathione peroxidase
MATTGGTMTQAQSLYDIELERLDGGKTSLREYQGKVLLIVNVASRCGLTPQYEGLEALHRKYGERGLTVLGFPSNQFGAQEPGTPAQIAEFCSTKYDVTFPLFAKADVNGADEQPLYRALKQAPQGAGGDIAWNFAKFLVGRDGQVIARYDPRSTPEQLAADIERALA